MRHTKNEIEQMEKIIKQIEDFGRGLNCYEDFTIDNIVKVKCDYGKCEICVRGHNSNGCSLYYLLDNDCVWLYADECEELIYRWNYYKDYILDETTKQQEHMDAFNKKIATFKI